jgi:hypothetical protein
VLQSYALVDNNLSARPRLIVNVKEAVTTKIIMYNSAGQTTHAKQVMLQAGQNNIELPVSGMNDGFHIVALYINNQLQFSGKVMF